MAATLPFLTIAATPSSLGVALLLFGGALGSLDVAVNVHAVEVERASAKPLMSGFQALFSIGGFAGAALMTLFLSMQIDLLIGSLVGPAGIGFLAKAVGLPTAFWIVAGLLILVPLTASRVTHAALAR